MTIQNMMEYNTVKRLRGYLLLSNIFSPVDQHFLLNVLPAESTHTKARFTLLCILFGEVNFKCACGTLIAHMCFSKMSAISVAVYKYV